MTLLFRRGDLVVLNKSGMIYHSACGHLNNGSTDMPSQPVVGMVINDMQEYDTMFENMRDTIKRAANMIALPDGTFTTFPWMIEKLK